MSFFLVWLVCTILVGVYAVKKGRSFIGYALLAFLLSPLLAFLILLCLADLRKKEEAEKRAREERIRHEETLEAIREAGGKMPEKPLGIVAERD